MNKAHSPINWVNEPSTDSPLNAANLNKMDNAIGVIDDRVINLSATSATKTEVSTLISEVTWNPDTGVITFVRKNGGSIHIDTKLEKLAVNFAYDEKNERLIITLDDGTVQYVDLSALIVQYDFVESATISLTVSGGKVAAHIKGNSITDEMLESGYLAKVTAQADRAEDSANNAKSSENSSKYYSEVAQGLVTDANTALEETNKTLVEVGKKVTETTFTVNLETGNLEYESPNYDFSVNENTGNLEWEVA